MGNQATKLVKDETHEALTTEVSSVHDGLMRQQIGRDPMQIYSVIEVLGVGSMGSVSKVKRKESVMGGSARSSFVESFRNEPICYRLPLSFCFGKGHKPAKAGLLVTPDGSNHGSTRSNPKLFKKTSSIISYQHKDAYFALKSIHLNQAKDETFKQELRNEVEILKKLDHPNIVRPLETFTWKDQLYIVIELCSGGDLYARDPYTEKDAARIASSILSAVGYMHSHNITHRDLKYENVMFTNREPNADIKIIDFGLSRKYGPLERLHDSVGTIYSMSPEVLRGDYTNKVDVWSVGVLTFMLLSSSMPFYGRSRKHVMQKILRGSFSFKGRVWRYISKEAKDFVSELLKYDANERPTAEEALQNDWLHTQNDMLAPEMAKMDVVQASIEQFAGYGTLKKLALMVIAHQSTSEDIGFLRKIWKKYDDNRDGELTLAEFKTALSEYDYEEEEIERMFKGMDIDRAGKVHYSEFIGATIEAHGSIEEERLAAAFDRMDSDDSGYISVKDLASMLPNMKQSYIDSIIDEADLTHDHQIEYEEFLAMWSNEEEEDQRKRTLEKITKRRLLRTTTLSATSSMSSMDHYLEVEELTACPSEDSVGISGNFVFQQEKAKSVRSFADI